MAMSGNTNANSSSSNKSVFRLPARMASALRLGKRDAAARLADSGLAAEEFMPDSGKQLQTMLRQGNPQPLGADFRQACAHLAGDISHQALAWQFVELEQHAISVTQINLIDHTRTETVGSMDGWQDINGFGPTEESAVISRWCTQRDLQRERANPDLLRRQPLIIEPVGLPDEVGHEGRGRTSIDAFRGVELDDTAVLHDGDAVGHH